MEADGTSAPVVALGLVSRIGDNLKDQMPDTARGEHGWVLADAGKVMAAVPTAKALSEPGRPRPG